MKNAARQPHGDHSFRSVYSIACLAAQKSTRLTIDYFNRRVDKLEATWIMRRPADNHVLDPRIRVRVQKLLWQTTTRPLSLRISDDKSDATLQARD